MPRQARTSPLSLPWATDVSAGSACPKPCSVFVECPNTLLIRGVLSPVPQVPTTWSVIPDVQSATSYYVLVLGPRCLIPVAWVGSWPGVRSTPTMHLQQVPQAALRAQAAPFHQTQVPLQPLLARLLANRAYGRVWSPSSHTCFSHLSHCSPVSRSLPFLPNHLTLRLHGSALGLFSPPSTSQIVASTTASPPLTCLTVVRFVQPLHCRIAGPNARLARHWRHPTLVGGDCFGSLPSYLQSPSHSSLSLLGGQDHLLLSLFTFLTKTKSRCQPCLRRRLSRSPPRSTRPASIVQRSTVPPARLRPLTPVPHKHRLLRPHPRPLKRKRLFINAAPVS